MADSGTLARSFDTDFDESRLISVNGDTPQSRGRASGRSNPPRWGRLGRGPASSLRRVKRCTLRPARCANPLSASHSVRSGRGACLGTFPPAETAQTEPPPSPPPPEPTPTPRVTSCVLTNHISPKPHSGTQSGSSRRHFTRSIPSRSSPPSVHLPFPTPPRTAPTIASLLSFRLRSTFPPKDPGTSRPCARD